MKKLLLFMSFGFLFCRPSSAMVNNKCSTSLAGESAVQDLTTTQFEIQETNDELDTSTHSAPRNSTAPLKAEVAAIVKELVELLFSEHFPDRSDRSANSDMDSILLENLIAEKKLSLSKTFNAAELQLIFRQVQENASALLLKQTSNLESAAAQTSTPKNWGNVNLPMNPRLLYKTTTTSPLSFATFSPDGREILTAAALYPANDAGRYNVDFWDAKTGEWLRSFRMHSDHISTARYSQDQQSILTSSWDGSVKIWSAETGEQKIDLTDYDLRFFHRFKFTFSHRQQHDARFSPDEQRVVVASDANTVSVWDVPSGKRLFKIKGHNQGTTRAMFSHNGNFILTTGMDGQAILWDTRTGLPKRKLNLHPWTYDQRAVTTAAFSRDDHLVLTAQSDGKIVLLNPDTGSLIATFDLGRGWFHSAEFSKNGSWFMIASGLSVVLIDTKAKRQIYRSPHLPDYLTSASISPDQKHIVFTEGRNFHVLELYDNHLLDDH